MSNEENYIIENETTENESEQAGTAEEETTNGYAGKKIINYLKMIMNLNM